MIVASRCAIVLNNQAVTLLEGLCLEQAQATLCEAMTLLKRYRSRDDCEQASCAEDIDAALRRASVRVSRPVMTEHDAPPMRLSITILSEDHKTCLFGSSLATEPCGIYPVRIETSKINDSTHLEVDYISGILAYNCGLAHLCHAKLHPHEAQAQCSTALAWLAVASRSCPVLKEDEPMRSLSVAMMVQHSLIDALRTLGRHQDVAQQESRLAHLRNVAQHMDAVSRLSASMVSAASAA